MTKSAKFQLPRPVRWSAYLLALVVTGATLAVRMSLASWFGDRPMLLLFVLPIFVTAYVGGLGPGLVATAVAALGASYWLIPPLNSFAMGSSVDTWDWLILILVGALISTLTEVRLKRARQEEATPSRRGDSGAEHRVQLGFGLALSCLGVVGVISFTSVTRLSEDADHTRHTQEVITSLRTLLSATTDVEAAQHSFVVAGSATLLDPYALARHRLENELGNLRRLTADNAGQQRQLTRLSPLLSERIDETRHDQVHAILAEMEATERTLLQERDLAARHSVTVTHTVISFGSALAIGCVVIALFLIRGDFAGSRRAKAGLQEANEQLEGRVLERTAALAKSEARLGGIVASAMDAIISVDREQRIVLFNAAAETLFGRSAGAALGQPLDPFIPPHFREHHRQHVADFGSTGVTSRSMRSLRALTALGADGSEFPIEASISQVEVQGDKIYTVILRDLTERKTAEARAVWLSSFPERNPSPIVELDPHSGVMHYVNPAAMRQFPRLESEGLRHPLVAGLEALLPQLAEQDTVHRELVVDEAYFSQLLTSVAGGSRVRIYSTDVTARRHAEQALREREAELHASDRRLAEIVHGMTEACFALGAQWRFTFVNDRVETLLHSEREQMLGKAIWEVFPALLGTVFETNYRRAMSERTPISFEVFSPLSERWLDIRLFPTAGAGLAVFLLDIQMRKRAELEREKFVSLVEYSAEFIGMRNLQGVPIFVNRAALQLVGLDSLEHSARVAPADFFFPEDQAFVRDEFVPRVLRDGHGETELRFRHFKTGEAIWMIYNAFVVRDAHGQPTALATVSRNITERKLAEQEILQLNTSLERRVVERTDQLEAANKELEAFSYSVSHDLRAPLRAVSGFSQIVLEDYGPQLPEEAQQHLQTICDGAQRMGALIDDLLAFARLSRLPLTRQTVDVARQVGDSLAELAPEHRGRALDIRIGELPACHGDPALLKQVWLNLISNALKYTKNQELPVIEIGSALEDGSLVYFVRDNGTGFDMRYAGKLFGVFQRLHRQEEFAGTGVGLAIVQRIVNRHGGRIWADATVGSGATFYFTLPGGNT